MANKRVLILDDDNDFLDELSEMLASNGYEPVIASDTDGFLNLAAKIKPAVILLDLKMPKKTGFLVAYELNQSSETTHIPVIAISGVVKDDFVVPKEFCNIRAFLKKPLHPLDVIKEIEKVLLA